MSGAKGMNEPLLYLLLVFIALLTLILHFVYAGMAAIVRSNPQIVRWLLSHPRTTAALSTIAVLAIGAAASYWKQSALRSYSAVEIAFGAAISSTPSYL
jgi:hypothetical protein